MRRNPPQTVILSDHNGISPRRVPAKELALKFDARSFANNHCREMRFWALRMTGCGRSSASQLLV